MSAAKSPAVATKTVPWIAFPWAVSITVGLSLIPGLFLGKWNFTLWVSFITWAEYFVFGAKPSVGKNMLPGLAFGCATAAVWMANWIWFNSLFGVGDPFSLASWAIIAGTNLIWVTGLVYGIDKIKMFNDFALAVFNGLTLFLAVYFTTLGGSVNSIPQVGPLSNPYWVIFWCFVWTLAMEYFGYVLAVFNVWLTTFTREVKA